MSSLSGSIVSLNTVKEEDDEEAPPVPSKNRPPSDPDQRSLNGAPNVPFDHGRKSLPASMMSYWADRYVLQQQGPMQSDISGVNDVTRAM